MPQKLLFMQMQGVLLTHINSHKRQILGEGKRKNFLNQEPPAQSRRDFRTQHLGIAASDINPIFLVGKTAGKLLPALHNLYLIKEENRLSVKHFLVCGFNGIQIRQSHHAKTVVLKIEVADFLYAMPRRQ